MSTKYTILIVDDESINRLLLSTELIKEGFRTIEAVNGEDALEKIISDPPDLVLLDVMMPKVSGFEVCRKIKGNKAVKDIPVILVTALSSREDIEQGTAAGADEFISKPVNIRELSLRVHTLLQIHEMTQFIQRNSVISRSLEEIAGGIDGSRTGHREAEDLITSMVGLNIRSGGKEKGKPEYIFISLKLKNVEWPGRLFSLNNNSLEFKDVDIPLQGDSIKNITLFKNNGYIANWQSHCASPEEFQEMLPDSLRSLQVPVSNFLYFENNNQRVLLLNFGREIRPYDITWYAHAARYTLALSILLEQMGEKEEEYIALADTLSNLTELKENAPGKHNRIQHLCGIFCRELQCSSAFTELLKDAARIFDIGKTLIDESILMKKGPLTEEEWKLIRKVPAITDTLFENLPRLMLAKEIGTSIYEKFDGSGYPSGRQGEEIPLSARIFSLINTYDALRSPKSYRCAYTHEEAVSILSLGDGRLHPDHFDPKLMNLFLKNSEEIRTFYSRFLD